MPTAYASLYQSDFRLSESQQRLLDLAQRYVDETEAYDRTVCTGPIRRDGIMPVTRHEFALVNLNARLAMDRICAAHPEFNRQEILRAVSRIDNRGTAA
ncbi:hypothetical protein HDC30_000889 [Pseudomonas sp. JAI115]|uniref:hypothetical protein n=1 Tax=Pseudomonas sp. JAI115 TaxID=2723061 RepID=UPI00161EB852|nr:hypothetical protein [Pseudomonas sp. JAI115]MBB6153695.1 hypothetical protein [Pseudomonas sp. JAI115]